MLTVLLLSGCATYHAMPLTRETVKQTLAPPDSEELRLRAASITHPVLKPLVLDASDGLSPDEAAVLAVILNPQLRAERDRKGIAGAEIIKAGILPNPRLSYSFEIPVGGVAPDTVNAYGFGLGWDVKALISREARRDAARARLASVELDVAWREWQVAEEAKVRLYRLIIAKERAGLEQKRTKDLEKIYALTQGAVGLGVKTSGDLLRAGADLEDGHAALIKARGAVVAQRLALNRAIGLPPGTRTTTEKAVNMAIFSKVPGVRELTKGLDKRRLDLTALRLGYKSEEARLRAAVLSQFPAIKIGPIAAKDTDGVKTAGGLFGMDIPIFDRNQGSIAAERATRKRLFDEYTARLFEARSLIARLVNNLSSLTGRIAKIEKSARDMKGHVEGYEKAVEGGVFNALDYYRLRARLQERRLEGLMLKGQEVEQAVSLEMASGQYIFTEAAEESQKSGVVEKAEVLR